jgi:hypothetical protein
MQRRVTGDRREFAEVMAMARRTSSQTGTSPVVHSRRPTNMQVRRERALTGGAEEYLAEPL